MNKIVQKLPYESPCVEPLRFQRLEDVLLNFSAEATFEEFEEGDEI